MKNSQNLKTRSKIDALLEDISKLVAATLKIDSVSILTLDEQKKQPRLRSVVGEPIDEKFLQAQSLGDSVVEWAKKLGDIKRFDKFQETAPDKTIMEYR